MRIVTVSGAHSGIGKTRLVEKLLNQLKGFSALKVTAVKDSACPRGLGCGICKEQNIPFTIISAAKIINQKGKDTQRMKAAGAKKVLWLRASASGLKEGLKQALKKFKYTKGVVIEGTSILKYLKPDLGIFIDAQGKTKILKCSSILTDEK